jgi:hypothetical protein
MVNITFFWLEKSGESDVDITGDSLWCTIQERTISFQVFAIAVSWRLLVVFFMNVSDQRKCCHSQKFL